MEKLRHGSLFSGIGGFDLAAEWMGWVNVFHCEWNEFGQKVLKHYWPQAESFSDITKTDFTKYYGTVDIISGGFPCQPYSSAGKRKGKEDERHLWPEMCRAIREVSPRFVVGENVRGLTNWNGGLVFDEVCAELESLGYQVAPVIIPACGVDAPHRRERIWFVAYAVGSGHNRPSKADRSNITRQEWKLQTDIRQNRNNVWCKTSGCSTNYSKQVATNSNGAPTQCRNGKASQRRKNTRGRIESLGFNIEWEKFPTQSPVCGGNDGLPGELDGITFSNWRAESIKAYGNAIVPQVAYEIFKALEKSLYL